MTQCSPFRYFKISPDIIRLAVLLYIRYPLSLRNVEDLLRKRGIDISFETVRIWWNRFGPKFAAVKRKRRVQGLKSSRLNLLSRSGIEIPKEINETLRRAASDSDRHTVRRRK